MVLEECQVLDTLAEENGHASLEMVESENEDGILLFSAE